MPDGIDSTDLAAAAVLLVLACCSLGGIWVLLRLVGAGLVAAGCAAALFVHPALLLFAIPGGLLWWLQHPSEPS